jgi:hypothetical protein
MSHPQNNVSPAKAIHNTHHDHLFRSAALCIRISTTTFPAFDAAQRRPVQQYSSIPQINTSKKSQFVVGENLWGTIGSGSAYQPIRDMTQSILPQSSENCVTKISAIPAELHAACDRLSVCQSAMRDEHLDQALKNFLPQGVIFLSLQRIIGK